MELKWLEDFVSLANTRSFSRSAQERNVTQPAFSRRIRQLELWLGADLIDRSTYPTTLTDAGRTFRSVAEDFITAMHRQRDEFRGARSRAGAAIRFSALHTLSMTFFPRWLREVERALGPLNTRMMPGNLHDCVESLTEGDCDFLLCYGHDRVPILLDPALYPSLTLARDRLLLVATPEEARRFPGTPAEPLRLLAYTADCLLGRVVDHLMERIAGRCHLEVFYENPMAEALKAMALEGHGAAWLPESSIPRELSSGALVTLGDADVVSPLDVRLYRSLRKAAPSVVGVWSHLTNRPPAPIPLLVGGAPGA
ncbi:LysR family transcriptional regulator [Azospirillum griseum]|uniref:LysR family transcriptional regulator n=1 Tax=Azospirillum griseum TaxID=2496639 RepID=A0A3S0IHD0_9PROT|nr:LysR family transcriptional regulator [Azospirillum griseum]RTR23012.1 LysR family transcriptional regulator [Azospirillum griseum]